VHDGQKVGPEAEPIDGIGSFIAVFGMLLSGWIVYQGSRAVEVSSHIGAPAE